MLMIFTRGSCRASAVRSSSERSVEASLIKTNSVATGRLKAMARTRFKSSGSTSSSLRKEKSSEMRRGGGEGMVGFIGGNGRNSGSNALNRWDGLNGWNGLNEQQSPASYSNNQAYRTCLARWPCAQNSH